MKKKLNPTWTKILIYGLFYAITILIIISSSWFSATASTRFPWLRLIIIFFATTLLIKYFVYMLMSPWYDVWSHWETIESKKETFTPKVSVIIPAWNEEVGILNTLRSLLNSTYRNIEVIVINDGSVDSSDALIRAFCATVTPKNPQKSSRSLFTTTKRTRAKVMPLTLVSVWPKVKLLFRLMLIVL